MALSDSPLAEARLDSALFHLDVMSSFEGAADRVTTDAIMIERYYFVAIGL